jgi:outer membrane protein TolC
MRKSIILTALSLLLSVGANAEALLTIDDCITLAKENNRQLAASRFQQEATDFNAKSMKANFFPTISLTGTALYSSADGSYSSGSGMLPVVGADGTPVGQFAYFPGIDLNYKVGALFNGGVKLEQPIYMGGKILTGYRMAKLGSSMAQQNVRRTESEVILATSQAYAGVVKATELRKVALSYNSLLTELMRSVEKAKLHGVKSQNDVLKVQVKLNESELNLRKADNAVRLAKMNLCHYIGRPLTDSIDVTSTLPFNADQASANAGIYERPEYHLMEQQTEMANQKIKLARSEYLPQVGLVGMYNYTNGGELNGTKVIDGGNYLVGVQVSIPVYDFGYRTNKIKAAKAQYNQAQQEQEDTNELLTLQLTQAINNLDESQLELKLAESSVSSAEENLRMSNLQYDHGVETISDLLEAQTLYQQALQTKVEAYVNCYLRWLEYRKSAGLLN